MLPLNHVDEALDAAEASVSLDQAISSDDDAPLAVTFADEEAVDPYQEAGESLRDERVRAAVAGLPAREREVVELRFGFGGGPQTLEAIARELELTRERVRQIVEQALSRLAHEFAA